MLNIVDLFEVKADIDQNSGQGGTRSLGYFRTADDASAAADGQGVQGTPGLVMTRKAIPVGDGSYLLLAETAPIVPHPSGIEVARKRALGKLDAADRRALGLDPWPA